MRCFIAIELPPGLKREVARLADGIADARRVPAEQLHLTLAFLGELDESTVATLGERLAAIDTPAFHLRPERCGCFPDRRRPRVLWVGFAAEPLLERLARDVAEAAAGCGIALEERPFAPHVTLARIKPPARPDIAPFLARSADRLPPCRVAAFHLFRSRLTPEGAVHTIIRSFPLPDPD